MAGKSIFKGVFPVLSLPFTEKKEIDYESLKKLINFCLSKKSNGLVIFGVASEFYKITDLESKKVIEIIVKEVNGQVPLIVGVGKLSTETTIMQAEFCQEVGADGIMIFPPYFIPLSKIQLFEHYMNIANSVKLPVIIQDAPQVSGVNMDIDFFIKISEKCKNIKYAKIEGPFSGPKIQLILEAAGDRINIFDGWGGTYFYEHLLRGVCGLMPGCSAIEIFVEVFKNFQEGKLDKSWNLYKEILPLIILQGQDSELYVACEKEMLKHRGIINYSESRSPKIKIDDITKDLLLKNLEKLLQLVE